MAKDKAKSASSHGSRAYMFAAFLVAIIYVINAVLVDRIYANNRTVSSKTSNTMSAVNRMNSELSEVNGEILAIIANVGSTTGHANAVTQHFSNIQQAIEDFEDISDMNEDATRRFNHAKVVINTYSTRLQSFRDMWNSANEDGSLRGSAAFGDEMNAFYIQDIYPLQVTASEMLRATIDIVNNETSEKMAKNTKNTYLLMALMLLVAILSEVAIFIIAKRAKKARLDLEEREKNLREVDAKLKSTRQKASDLAIMNILTGMKNRYALDNDITERLESDRFNIAVFDMDNFRSINDTYGYDFGDEYLVAVAERLKSEFGSMAEIYNITGNEFCFVFNKEISESQAMGIVQNIHAVMCSPYEVLNLTVQLPTSGSVYHYLPGDCLNVNSLLVKLDTALRNAKLNGGNMINTVVDI
jgi:diguanylate cyclase (GGDEF)-like protein